MLELTCVDGHYDVDIPLVYIAIIFAAIIPLSSSVLTEYTGCQVHVDKDIYKVGPADPERKVVQPTVA
jgi:hypothetical protein